MTTATTSSEISHAAVSSRLMAVLCGMLVVVIFPPELELPFFIEALVGSALLALVATRPEMQRRQQKVSSDLLDIALWFPAAYLITFVVLFLLALLSPKTIDSALDLGVGRHMMAWASLHPASKTFFRCIYVELPVAMAVVVASSKEPLHIVRALVVAALLALPFYVVFPATGPLEIGQREAARNCMPSLHFTWAIMLAYYSTRRLRPAFILFAALTAISTLTTGEHYLVDLIAAIPFTWFCIWAVAE